MAKHNAGFQAGQTSFTVGVNKYSDKQHDEFNKRMLGFRRLQPGANVTVGNTLQFTNPNNKLAALPESVDWRTKGWVTPVRDQGWCGSCYTFSACGALEGAYAKKYKKLIDCSEQNLLDCTHDEATTYRNLGCDGGEMWRCFEYIKVGEHTRLCQ
jgi:C1A family cysteine protease